MKICIKWYANMLIFFCWKNVSSFCSAKATHIFSAKNIRILHIKSAKTVNKMTLNELVKLTMLWTTGPCTSTDAVWSLFALHSDDSQGLNTSTDGHQRLIRLYKYARWSVFSMCLKIHYRTMRLIFFSYLQPWIMIVHGCRYENKKWAA